MAPPRSQDPHALYDRFCQRFSERSLCEGEWRAKDDKALASFHDQGLALYPREVRPGPRQRAALDQHPLFNLAYVAMRADDILITSWPLILQWFRAGEPLNERERLYLASMAVQRLENDYVWYQEAEPHQLGERRAAAQKVLGVAQDLGWDPRATLREFPKDWTVFRKAWTGFLHDHPIGPFFRGWEEERVLRKALATIPVEPISTPRRRL